MLAACAGALVLLSSLLQSKSLGQGDSDFPPLPELDREFRGVWVATVANIDWPNKPGLSTEEQKSQAINIMDRCQELGLNVIVLQVRTSCDALYRSDLEPWSYYLTGEQGQAPEPMYDPLDFWIEQTHLRGMELHAWFNPYRARNSGQKYSESPSHISKTHPELVKRYGNDKTS
ncbi:MAG: glycoside hydrolase family 10 protein, partial [Pirellula sp.]